MSNVGIMIDLDALLDTRYATLKTQQPEVFEKIEHSPKYFLRTTDQWKDVHPEFNHRSLMLSYQGRNLDTIKASQITAIIRYVIDTVGNIKASILSGDPEVSGLFFVLNIYPYKIDSETLTELARFAIHQLGFPDIPIGFIDLPFEKISLDYLRDNSIYHWYCYHYQDWMNAQFNNIAEGTEKVEIDGFAECKLYCPKLSDDQNKIDELMDTLLESVDIDQFALTKVAFSSIININFLPVSSFSRLDVNKLIMAEKGEDVNRSNVINIFYEAVEEIKFRLGEEKIIDYQAVAEKMEVLGPKLIELQALNQVSTMGLFRVKLAEFMIEVASIYNSTPFNAGDDLENTLNHMSLQVDTTVDEYLETEEHWNKQGIKTIRREYRLPSGELIYRCIDADTGQLLESIKPTKLKLSAVDDLVLGNYFRGQVYGCNDS